MENWRGTSFFIRYMGYNALIVDFEMEPMLSNIVYCLLLHQNVFMVEVVHSFGLAEEMDWDKNGMVNFKEFLFAFTRWVGIDENEDGDEEIEE